MPFLLSLILLSFLCTPKPLTAFQVRHAPKASKSASMRVLFVGNSLTAANDVPGLIRAIAGAAGVPMEVASCLTGGFNLEDHWRDGRCRKLLTMRLPHFIVLQQGPSSRPENQADLKKWSGIWAKEARIAGVKPALYMVWPYQNQPRGFELVTHSYRSAAKAAGARLLPAGEAWRKWRAIHADVPLYSPDNLHPTGDGSYLAALVITRGLIGKKMDRNLDVLPAPSGSANARQPAIRRKLQRVAKSVYHN